MRNLGFSHVAIGVDDMDAAIIFYRDVADLTLSRDSREHFVASRNVPAHERRGAYFRWSDGRSERFLVLDHHRRQARPEPREIYGLGIHHFAFWVSDVDAVLHRAEAAGAEIFVPPMEVDGSDYAEPSGSRIRTLLLRDPDGNIVQFDQRVAE